jgi:hypothetical protein
MKAKPSTREDTLRFEKLTLLILTVCLVVLVGVQVYRFF